MQMTRDTVDIYGLYIKYPIHHQDMIKAITPDLGELCSTLFLCCNESQVTPLELILREFFARCVLWWGGLDSSYVQHDAVIVDDNRFTASRVGARLLLICRTLSETIHPNRAYGGRTSLSCKDNFRNELKRIYEIDTFEDFVKHWRKSNCAHDMDYLLERAIYDSQDLGYHDECTDFGRIGKIKGTRLLRGESRMVPIETVTVRTSAMGGLLCVAAHPYDTNSRLGTVCYNNRTLDGIVHSGDTWCKGENVHVVQINLGFIASWVSELYLTVSACGTETLGNFQSMHMQTVNQRNEEIVNYSIDALPRDARSAILGRLWKDGQGKWQIQALATTCRRRCCGNYSVITSIIDDIRNGQRQLY